MLKRKPPPVSEITEVEQLRAALEAMVRLEPDSREALRRIRTLEELEKFLDGLGRKDPKSDGGGGGI